MTEMNLTKYQSENANQNLLDLARSCRCRFLRAANLLEINNENIHALELAYSNTIDLRPLRPAWVHLCERYNTERVDFHPRLLNEFVDDVIQSWSKFVYHDLFPKLDQDDEFVRNVLRALDLIPSRSAENAAKFVYFYFDEMTLPDSPPPWDEGIEELRSKKNLLF